MSTDNSHQLKIWVSSVAACILITLLWRYAVGCSWKSNLDVLFSGLAFVMVICTALLQSAELSLQRKDLEDTNEAVRRSATAQEKSEKALTRQIQSLNITALLNGYSAKAEYFNNQAQYLNLKADRVGGEYGDQAAKAADNAKDSVAKIDDLIQDIVTRMRVENEQNL